MRALAELSEPIATRRLHELLASTRQRLTAWQRAEIKRWESVGPFEHRDDRALGAELDHAARIRGHHARFVRRHGGSSRIDARTFDALPPVLAQAADKPALVSAVVWTWLGARDPAFASLLVHLVRGRAGLPGLRRELGSEEPGLRVANRRLELLAARFADLQAEDACAWAEHLGAPLGPGERATLSEQQAAIAQARAEAPRIGSGVVAGFLRRAASYLVQLSTQGGDPLGFALGREAQLEADPAIARRIEIAAWARRAGHRISPRGQLLVLSLPVEAPWPLRLELVAAEPGYGQTGSLGLLLRLDAGGTSPVTSHAPVLLWFPGEPPEELGPRFERWLASAYPHATESWRAWC